MKPPSLLTLASLSTAVLLSFHLSDDIVLGIERGGLADLLAVPILVVWLFATVGLGERRAGLAFMLLGSLLGLYVPYLHFAGRLGVIGPKASQSAHLFFFVWTLLALGVTSLSGALLAARGLWRSFTAPHAA